MRVGRRTTCSRARRRTRLRTAVGLLGLGLWLAGCVWVVPGSLPTFGKQGDGQTSARSKKPAAKETVLHHRQQPQQPVGGEMVVHNKQMRRGESESGRRYQTPEAQPSQEEWRLHEMINAHRARHRLPPVSLSLSLSYVARLHARDLQDYPPNDPCNLHSWSGRGRWTPCCYIANHARAECMWGKPEELTAYPGLGYEISFWHSQKATPEEALNGWRKSAEHEAVVLNRGEWTERPWQAMGVGINDNYAVVWFGHETDSAGYWLPGAG